MATYSSILARKIPRIEESGGLQSMGGGGVHSQGHPYTFGMSPRVSKIRTPGYLKCDPRIYCFTNVCIYKKDFF